MTSETYYKCYVEKNTKVQLFHAKNMKKSRSWNVWVSVLFKLDSILMLYVDRYLKFAVLKMEFVKVTYICADRKYEKLKTTTDCGF